MKKLFLLIALSANSLFATTSPGIFDELEAYIGNLTASDDASIFSMAQDLTSDDKRATAILINFKRIVLSEEQHSDLLAHIEANRKKSEAPTITLLDPIKKNSFAQNMKKTARKKGLTAKTTTRTAADCARPKKHSAFKRKAAAAAAPRKKAKLDIESLFGSSMISEGNPVKALEHFFCNHHEEVENVKVTIKVFKAFRARYFESIGVSDPIARIQQQSEIVRLFIKTVNSVAQDSGFDDISEEEEMALLSCDLKM